ncbi:MULTISPECIES: type II toxin-antitoxin system HicB family antitoxin [Rhizobium/Agrobacterium group]|uniref:HicB-like antitoxin of toxin-antitoxin system domain-containing protein n=2 Tax=Rhizobium/Agrobacterium group TaxID=227290 RepID=B9JWL6_ALLAM|nr:MULTISPECIES: type II toxin-antitoxin system HicB family antitoxin [Rhizobium/Agrobacterium group]ACM36644.1 conserved hypothetical protein [Allorhizobium ampelinum S4]MUO27453.1 HicB family protein [Agrobacterium vitis]MUO42097.1 HicB family protein [Agrobacterium vitis]MUP09405.1 HicB family protein [Agrobacterium vitis]
MNDYPMIIVPLSENDGGGFMSLVPDLPGCMSDGETQSEALQNGLLAVKEWIDEAKRLGKEVPEPGAAAIRAAKKDRAMAKAFKTLASKFDDIDGRVQDLEENIKELSSTAQNMDDWVRFSGLTGLPLTGEEPKALPC